MSNGPFLEPMFAERKYEITRRVLEHHGVLQSAYAALADLSQAVQSGAQLPCPPDEWLAVRLIMKSSRFLMSYVELNAAEDFERLSQETARSRIENAYLRDLLRKHNMQPTDQGQAVFVEQRMRQIFNAKHTNANGDQQQQPSISSNGRSPDELSSSLSSLSSNEVRHINNGFQRLKNQVAAREPQQNHSSSHNWRKHFDQTSQSEPTTIDNNNNCAPENKKIWNNRPRRGGRNGTTFFRQHRFNSTM